MADTDQSLSTLRYNQVTGELEGFGGGTPQWTPLALANPGEVPSSRTISTTAPLTGGGDLSANRTIAIAAATDSVNGYLTAVDHASYTTAVSQAAAALPSASFTDTAVTGKVLTGYTSGAGTVAATDTILQAIQKLNGNQATYLPLAGGTLTGALTITPTTNQLVLGTTRTVTLSASTPATSSRIYTFPDAGAAANVVMDHGNYTISGTWTGPTFVTPALGTPVSGVLTNCTGLPVAGGGTGQSSLTAHAILVGNTTSAVSFVGPSSTSGFVLTSAGSSADPAYKPSGVGNVATTATSGTITPDASTGNTFYIVVSGAVTLNGPSNGVDGQKVTIRILNDASHSVTLTTTSTNFRFGTDITSYTNSVSKTDYIGAIWNNAASFWDVVSVIQGF